MLNAEHCGAWLETGTKKLAGKISSARDRRRLELPTPTLAHSLAVLQADALTLPWSIEYPQPADMAVDSTYTRS